MATRFLHRSTDSDGFTLIEVILVVIIAGFLVTVALRSGGVIYDSARTEETKQELEALATAMVGNPELQNNGVRSDFGYVGDVGAMPPNLDALNNNPGYSTWKGPYIDNRFTQKVDDYKKDAWDANYSYSGVNITSSGSGSDIVQTLGNSAADFTVNQVSGLVRDLDGTPPGFTYRDSLAVRMTIPNGAGGTVIRTATVDIGGYFAFDSIPIGNHDIELIYIPDGDTLRRFVSVLPASSPYGEYSLANNVWSGGGGGGSGLNHIAGRDTVYSSPQCANFSFWVINNSGSQITVNSISLTYATPTAYYRYVRWGSTTVFNSNNPKNGSGEVASFSPSQSVNDGDSARVRIETFRNSPTGGSNVDMSNVDVTVLLSDGSTFDISFGGCP